MIIIETVMGVRRNQWLGSRARAALLNGFGTSFEKLTGC
jgi:hypothetical protein